VASTPTALAQSLADFLGRGDVAAADRFIQRTFFARTVDAVIEAWKGNLLHGPFTHIVNFMSNATIIPLSVVERLAAAALPLAKVPKTDAIGPPRKGSKLTLKQESFAHAYLETGNATVAYRRAYNAGGMSDVAIRSEAGRLLKNELVAAAVAAGREKLAAQHGISTDMVVRELKRIAFFDIRKLVEWSGEQVREEQKNGKVVVRGRNDVLLKASSEIDDDTAAAISEIVLTKDGLRVKLLPKDSALATLTRILGLTEDTRESGNITVQIVNFSSEPQQVPTLERKEMPTLERMRAMQRDRSNG
jgi:phage terminase small subunit